MRHEDFVKMPLEDMAEIVWRKGVFLSKKSFNNSSVELYSLYNFFVEIWFGTSDNVRDFNYLHHIRSSPKVDILDKYIKDEDAFTFNKDIN